MKCRRCGGLSHIARTRPAGLFATYEGLFFLSALTGLVIFAPLWVIPAVVVWFTGTIAYETFLFYRAPMIAVAESSVSDARYWERVGLHIIGALVVSVGLAILVQRAV